MNRWLIACIIAVVLAPTAAGATEINLNLIRLPERRTVEVPMLPAARIPDAAIKAKIRFEEGQSRIEVSYDNMKSAVLFGGDVTCYVLWGINRDGGAENLGELWVRPDKDKDTLKFSTGLRTFALLITAEPYYQVERPSELVISTNDRSTDPQAPASVLTFSAFDPAPRFGMETLANVRYDGKTPLDLLQAEKAFEIAGRLNAQGYAPAIYREADVALQQARSMARSDQARRGAQEYARRSVASSNEAIKISLRETRARELEERIAQRQAAMKLLEEKAVEAQRKAEEAIQKAGAAEARASEAENRARKTEAEAETRVASAEAQAGRIQAEAETAILTLQKQKSEAESAVQGAVQDLDRIRRERETMEQEKRSLEASLDLMKQEQGDLRSSLQSLQRDMIRVKEERGRLEGRLQEALSLVADTRNSARGLIVNLPDILFDVNEAALKPEAKIVVAKMAGILLIMQDLNLRIEGHTDSTGSASYNLQLSQRRAESVFDWFRSQGVSTQRMRAVGYGFDRPMADNFSADGRQKNRRVEIIIAEGEVREAPPR